MNTSQGEEFWKNSGKQKSAKKPVPGILTAQRVKANFSSSSNLYANNSTANSNSKIKIDEKETTPVENKPVEKAYSKAGAKREKIEAELSSNNLNLDKLRDLCWGGVPPDLRAQVWKFLLGYIPVQKMRRQATVERKRKEYMELTEQFNTQERSGYEEAQLSQIRKDVPRLHLSQKVFWTPYIQESLIRMLYLWALRHPVVGYVQGFNDLATVFFSVYLAEHCNQLDDKVDWGDAESVERVEKEKLLEVEADTFWTLAKLLDGIQDWYTSDRRGLFRMKAMIEEVVGKIDPDLSAHMKDEGILFEHFVTPWINCLLMRSFPLDLVCRLWDTYFSEGGTNVALFHPYVCAAFFTHWSKDLMTMDFQEALLFIQKAPTEKWGEDEISVLLSQSFMYQQLYQSANKLKL